MEKMFVKLFSFITTASIMLCSFGIEASAYDILDRTATMDNDMTGMSGYSNSGNFNILYGSEHMNGSARMQTSPMSSSYYRWNFPTLYHTFSSPDPDVYLVINAYVNSSTFEDNATYTVNVANTNAPIEISANLFQKYCHSGWYSMTKDASGVVGAYGGYNPNRVKINPSGYWYNNSEIRYCGADGIWVGFRYSSLTT